MSLTPVRSRGGPMPPGYVDGFCTTCKRESVVAEKEPRCPYCGDALDPLSLPTVPEVKRPPMPPMMPVPEIEPPAVLALPEPSRPGPKPLILPRVDELVKWRRDTEWRRDRLREQESNLSDVKRARQALDRVLEAVQLEPEETDHGDQ